MSECPCARLSLSLSLCVCGGVHGFPEHFITALHMAMPIGSSIRRTGSALHTRVQSRAPAAALATHTQAQRGISRFDRGVDGDRGCRNELFLMMAGKMATEGPEESRAHYTAWALKEWEWFRGSGMIGPDALINDGLDKVRCVCVRVCVWQCCCPPCLLLL